MLCDTPSILTSLHFVFCFRKANREKSTNESGFVMENYKEEFPSVEQQSTSQPKPSKQTSEPCTSQPEPSKPTSEQSVEQQSSQPESTKPTSELSVEQQSSQPEPSI